MFTKDLIDEAIKYFKENWNENISDETAEEYLNSLADLFESYAQLASQTVIEKNT